MTKMTGRIEIPLSKKKLSLMLIGSIAFVAIGLWFIINPPTISNPIFGNHIYLSVVGISSVLFFGICAIYIIAKLQDKKPGLIIDELGIIDNSSGVASGQILWTDIDSISVIEIYRQKIILLKVTNPQDYLDKQISGFKRKMMSLNFKMYGTPLSIASNGLTTSFEELLSIITDNFNANRQ